MPFGPAQGSSAGVGTTVEVSEIESLTDGHIIIGDGSGAPTTRAAFASSTGALTTLLAPAGGTVTASTPVVSGTQAWNAGGVAFNGLSLDITDTASATGSTFAEFLRGAAWAFRFFAKSNEEAFTIRNSAGGQVISMGPRDTSNGSPYINGAGSGINVCAAGVFEPLAASTLAQRGSNGQIATLRQLTESHTLAAAGTSDTTIAIPAGALVLGVGIRVTTTITGCTTLDVGVLGATTRYGTGIALTANTTNATCSTLSAPTVYQAATQIRFTAVGGGASFTAGVVRVTVHYVDITAPTS